MKSLTAYSLKAEEVYLPELIIGKTREIVEYIDAIPQDIFAL